MFKFAKPVLAAAAATGLLAGCASYYPYGWGYYGYGYGYYPYNGYYLSYYDDFYGPFYGGYWGADGAFYYRDEVGNLHRDDAGHFRSTMAPGYHGVQVRGRYTY
jgi:hypothetical protein